MRLPTKLKLRTSRILFAFLFFSICLISMSFYSVYYTSKNDRLISNRIWIFDKIEIKDIQWYNDGATAKCENGMIEYKFASILDQKYLKYAGHLKGTECILQFTIRNKDKNNDVKLSDFTVDVLDYKTPENCIAKTPMSSEEIEVIYMEIGKPKNGVQESFRSTKTVKDGTLNKFDFWRLKIDSSETLRIRVNATIEGLYNIRFKMKVSSFGYEKDGKFMAIGDSTWWYFKK